MLSKIMISSKSKLSINKEEGKIEANALNTRTNFISKINFAYRISILLQHVRLQ